MLPLHHVPVENGRSGKARTRDLPVWRGTLSQLSYTPAKMVEAGGLEPPTPDTVRTVRALSLSYAPEKSLTKYR